MLMARAKAEREVGAMDRDEALEMLRGGLEGIREWNRRRANGQRIPDLTVLKSADLSHSNLARAHLSRTVLDGADLSGAVCHVTTFANVDLSGAKGLDSVRHLGPSTIGTDTLFRSRGRIPEAFLRDC